MRSITSQTIAANKVEAGQWIALNPKLAGYFDDRDLSGVFLHQFDLENGSNKSQVPAGKDLRRIEAAVALGRLIVLSHQDAPLPILQTEKFSNRTRTMISEMGDDINPRNILHTVNERELLDKIIPNITDKPLLEQMLQLETNGDNAGSMPRVRVVDLLIKRIKEYANQVTIIDMDTNQVIRNEVIDKGKEGEPDIEFTRMFDKSKKRKK